MRTMWGYRLRDWLRAFRSYPIWPFCGWCRWRLVGADDIGWFYATPGPPFGGSHEERPICMHCLHGAVGKAHQDRWGIGER